MPNTNQSDALLGLNQLPARVTKTSPDPAVHASSSLDPHSDSKSFKTVVADLGHAKNVSSPKASSTSVTSEEDRPSGKGMPSEALEPLEQPAELEVILSLDIQFNGVIDRKEDAEAIILSTALVLEALPGEPGEFNDDIENIVNNPILKPELLAGLTERVQSVKTKIERLLFAELVDAKSTVSLDKSAASNDKADLLPAQNQMLDTRSLNAGRVELNVPARVGAPDWSEALAGKISLMINQRISSARIHINPPELGPVEVRVNLNSDQASVQFLSHSAQVRDALEQSIPRLREMLDAAGFTLADSDVSDQRENQQQRQNSDKRQEGEEDLPVSSNNLDISMGLIDHYV